MKLSVCRERSECEARVAISPDTATKLTQLGLTVAIESGSGHLAHFSDEDYAAAGALIEDTAQSTLSGASIVLTVQAPSADVLTQIPVGATLIGLLDPHSNPDAVTAYAAAGIAAFSLELLPRITRAQGMDALSSQSNLAGYRAVVDAAAAFGRAMPMMMTAAGTVAPARVLVMGAGVAGLQAIATARRLGAIVLATDVRPSAKEQVESLGATFLEVDSTSSENAETAGGYAREMNEDYQQRQAELVRQTLLKQDIVICTALIPGRPAPLLLTASMVRSMKPGSVIVDLAVERGGNCELSRRNEAVHHEGITILGYGNMPGRVATDASALYARNLLNFLTPLIESESDGLSIDWEDEVIKSTGLTRDGRVIHPAFTSNELSGPAAMPMQPAPLEQADG